MSPEAPKPDHNITLDLLKAFTPQWLELKLRHERSEGHDSGLTREYRDVNAHMNGLLEKLGVSDGKQG